MIESCIVSVLIPYSTNMAFSSDARIRSGEDHDDDRGEVVTQWVTRFSVEQSTISTRIMTMEHKIWTV